MPRITKRQFAAWSPVMLAIKITAGWTPHDYMQTYVGDGVYNKDFIEKLKMIVQVTDLDGRLGWITPLDRHLPSWMFQEIATILIKRIGVGPLLYWIRSVDNLFFLLSSFGVTRDELTIIDWSRLYPLNKIQKLRPWIRLYDVPYHILSILDQTGITRYIFHYFINIKPILKYGTGNTPGIWAPGNGASFCGIPRIHWLDYIYGS